MKFQNYQNEQFFNGNMGKLGKKNSHFWRFEDKEGGGGSED